MIEGATCKNCRKGRLVRREVSQTYERAGLEVSIDGIPALVCDQCSQIYFAPGAADKLASAANEHFALSELKHAGRYKAAL